MCKKNDSFLSDFHFNIEYFTWYVSLNIEYLDFDVIFATATLKSTLIKRRKSLIFESQRAHHSNKLFVLGKTSPLILENRFHLAAV